MHFSSILLKKKVPWAEIFKQLSCMLLGVNTNQYVYVAGCEV